MDAGASVAPNLADAKYMRRNLDTYFEFPPVFKPSTTRWGDAWNEQYPTPEPLLREVSVPYQQLYLDEAQDYTWICYVKLLP